MQCNWVNRCARQIYIYIVRRRVHPAAAGPGAGRRRHGQMPSNTRQRMLSPSCRAASTSARARSVDTLYICRRTTTVAATTTTTADRPLTVVAHRPPANERTPQRQLTAVSQPLPPPAAHTHVLTPHTRTRARAHVCTPRGISRRFTIRRPQSNAALSDNL